jgi:hypothetical protein
VLAFFRNNQIFTVIPLTLFAVLLHLPALFGWIQPDGLTVQHAGDLFTLLFGWTAHSPIGSAVIATVLVIIQAVLVNWLVNVSRINSERNWLLPLLYVYFTSCISDFQWTSPALVATTFIPLILRQLNAAYKGDNVPALAFNTGFLVGFGSLFYPVMLWLAPVFLLGFSSLRSLRLRELLVWLIGCWVPGFLGWLWSFWFDRGGAFRRVHLYELFQLCDFNFASPSLALQLQLALLGLILLVILLSYGTYYFKKLMQVQKLINILYWLIFATIVIWLFRHQPNIEHALLAAKTAGIFLGMSLQQLRNRLLAELFFFLLLIGAGVLLWLQQS